MKPICALLLVTPTLLVANPETPNFATSLEPVARLSLTETIKAGQLTFTPRRLPVIQRFAPQVESAVVSRMPAVDPSDRIHSEMPQLEPDSAREYRMLIKRPDVDVHID